MRKFTEFSVKNSCRAALVLVLGSASLGFVSGAALAGSKTTVPAGFDHYILYMGTGVFDPFNPEPRPGVTGCAGLFCDGNYFNKEVMKRTDAEIESLEVEAKAFFLTRFGIDVDDPDLQGRVILKRWGMNPDFEYRAYQISGMKVPPEGYRVRDGGWYMQITDPDGVPLGGEFAGTHGPANSFFFFGHYNIQIEKHGHKHDEEIVIPYKALTPVTPQPDGSFLIRCELNHPEWGGGIVQGQVANITLPNGMVKGNGRNVVTFPAVSRIDSFKNGYEVPEGDED